MSPKPSLEGRAPERAGEPRVVFYDDGRHAASLYQFEPPISPEDHTVIVDQLVDSGVDTLVYSAGVEGGVVQYDSRVAQKWGDNVTTWKHQVWYRAGRVLHQLIADGHDPLKLLCDRCHARGLWFMPSLWVGLVGGDRKIDGGLGRKSDFVYDHPQYQVGQDDDPRAQALLAARFSFLHPEVRLERLRVFEELLGRYATDGVEVDLANPDNLGPMCRFGEANRLAPLLTRWLGGVRNAARRAEALQRRRKRVYVRIPAHPESWTVLGYQVADWVRGKLVDGLVCVTSAPEIHDQDLNLARAVELTRGTGCRVIASCSNDLGRTPRQYATAAMVWAAAANAYFQGAEGFGPGDAHWSPNGWPWVKDEYQTLRLLGHPELLAGADKIYRVRSSGGRGILPGAAPPLPRKLSEAEPVEVPLRVADDLARPHQLGRLESARLRVRLVNFDASLADVEVELNGRRLPKRTRTWNDLTYRVRRTAGAGPYGYALQHALEPESFPRAGLNSVRVILAKADPMLAVPCEVVEVDCAIAYRLHRHFEGTPIDY